MLGILFGWRKASKCKKLIKRVQLRLKLMMIKRSAIAKQLREDIAKLLRDGHDQIAFNRLQQLYLDENMKEVYELLDNFCEFVLINLSYIKRHRDCPNDVEEAVSSLIFASARFGDLPELLLIRKLFGDRYGHKFATAAVELHPGNLVNPQMRDKLSVNSVTEFAKNRLLDEIIRECFFKPGLLAIEYNPSPPRPQASEAAECNDTEFMVPASMKSSDAKETDQSPSDFQFHLPTNDNSTIQSSSPSMMLEAVTFKEDDVEENAPESSSEYPEQSIVYLNDIEEFKSPARKDVHTVDEQDQRMFIFKPLHIQKAADQSDSPSSGHSRKKSARKRQRRRSLSKDYKHCMNDNGFEVYYSGTPRQIKHQKKIREAVNLAGEDEFDGLVQSFRFWLKEEEPETSPRRRSSNSSGIGNGTLARPPYLRATTMPQQRDRESRKSGFGRSTSLPVESPVELNRRTSASSSPMHVHPKLPDYDELEAKFMALKKVHQQANR